MEILGTFSFTVINIDLLSAYPGSEELISEGVALAKDAAEGVASGACKLVLPYSLKRHPEALFFYEEAVYVAKYGRFRNGRSSGAPRHTT